MNNPLIPLFLLLFCLTAHSQTENGWRWDDNKATFEPPALTPLPDNVSEGEWNAQVQLQSRQLRRSLDFYNRKASDILTRLHNCLRIISDKDAPPPFKESAIRTAKSLFLNQKGEIQESAKWRGLLLNNNYEIAYTFQDLDDYLTSLSNLFTEGKFVNVCWTESEAVDFEPYPGSGRLYRISKEDLSAKFYQRYLSKSFLREGIGFLNANGITVSKKVCKQVTFELRLFEIDIDVEIENPNDRFVWTVSINSVGQADDKDCKGLDDIECVPPDPEDIEFPEEPGRDTTNRDTVPQIPRPEIEIPLYQPVNPLTYFIPGSGFQHFRKLKNKKGFPTWPIITLTSFASIGTGIYYKTESNKSYKQYLNATTFADLNNKYDEASKENQIFLISAGAGLLTWAVSDLIVLFKDRKLYRENQEFIKNNTTLKVQPIFVPSESGIASGVGLKLRF